MNVRGVLLALALFAGCHAASPTPSPSPEQLITAWSDRMQVKIYAVVCSEFFYPSTTAYASARCTVRTDVGFVSLECWRNIGCY